MRKTTSDPTADESRSAKSPSLRFSDVQSWSTSVDDDWSTPSPRDCNNVGGAWTGYVRNLLDMFDSNASDNDFGDGGAISNSKPVSSQPRRRLMRVNDSNIAEECSGDHQLNSHRSGTTADPKDSFQAERADQRRRRPHANAPDATNDVTVRKNTVSGLLPWYEDRFSDNPADELRSSSNPRVDTQRLTTAEKNQLTNACVVSAVPSSVSMSVRPSSQSAGIKPRLSQNTNDNTPPKAATAIPTEDNQYVDDVHQQQQKQLQQPDHSLLGARAKTPPRLMTNENGSKATIETGAQLFAGVVPITVETEGRIPKSDFRLRRNAPLAGTRVHENEKLIDIGDTPPARHISIAGTHLPNGVGELEADVETKINTTLGRHDDHPIARQMSRRPPPKPVAGSHLALRPTASATTPVAAKMSPWCMEQPIDAGSSVDTTTSRRISQHRAPQMDQQQASAAANTYEVSHLRLPPLGVNQLQQGDCPNISTPDDVDKKSDRFDVITRRSSQNQKKKRLRIATNDTDAELNRVISTMSSAKADQNEFKFLIASRRNNTDDSNVSPPLSERPPTKTTQRFAGSGDHRVPLKGALNDRSSMYTAESFFQRITGDRMLLLLVLGVLCCFLIFASSFFDMLNTW